MERQGGKGFARGGHYLMRIGGSKGRIGIGGDIDTRSIPVYQHPFAGRFGGCMHYRIADERSPLRAPWVDARKKEERELATYLRQQHLPGVDADDDASVVLETEQARLVLFASAAVIAFEVTQLLASKRAVCVTPLYWSLFLLLTAIAGSWLALLWSERLRRFRVDRRYAIYHGDLDDYLTLEATNSPDHASSKARLDDHLAKEGTLRARVRWFRYGVAAVTAIGIGSGVLSAIGTADPQRCHFELLIPQR